MFLLVFCFYLLDHSSRIKVSKLQKFPVFFHLPGFIEKKQEKSYNNISLPYKSKYRYLHKKGRNI